MELPKTESASGPLTSRGDSDWSPRKLSQDAGRQEQRLYWAKKSIAERVAAAAELTKQFYRMRGIEIDGQEADFTVSRVRRQRG